MFARFMSVEPVRDVKLVGHISPSYFQNRYADLVIIALNTHMNK